MNLLLSADSSTYLQRVWVLLLETETGATVLQSEPTIFWYSLE